MAMSPEQKALLERRLAESGMGAVIEPQAQSPQWPADLAQRHAPFALTDVQYAYWLGRMAGFELGQVGSHGYQEWVYDDLDLPRYEAAWNALIARHDMLRAVVQEDGQQRIQAQVPWFDIASVDCRHSDPAQAGTVRAQLRERLSHRCYDPSQWPSFSLHALLMPGANVVMHVSADALFGDVYSAQVLKRELKQLYDAPEQALPALTFSFRDYVGWLQASEHTPEFDVARRWWQTRVQDMPAAPALPWLSTLPTVPRFERLALRLPQAAWTRLQNAGRRHGLSPSSLLLSAYAWVLRRWSGDARFTLNLTLFNRVPVHPDVAGLMGDFTQTLLFACHLDTDDSFLQAAQRIQHDFVADFDHRQYSGVRVLRDYTQAHPERQGSGPAALMPVVFTSALGARELAAGQHEAWRAFGRTEYEITQTPQVLLDHQVFEEQGALVVQWDAVPDAFPEGLLHTMFEALEHLLDDLGERPESWTATGPRDLPEAQAQVRRAVNHTHVPLRAQLLHEALIERVWESPEAPALVFAGHTWSRGLLWQWAERVALRLSAGLQTGEFIGVLLPRGPLQVAAVAGISLAGGAYVPLDPAWPAQRRDRVLARAGVRRVVLGNECVDLPDGIEAVCVDEHLPLACGALEVEAVSTEAAAYAIFTSGSTGEPKGVVMSHRAAWNTLADITRRFSLSAHDRVLGLSALSFDLSVFDIFAVLGAGGVLVLPDTGRERDVEHWRQLITDHQVTVWNSVPALLELLLAQPGDLQSLRLAMLSGDWIAPSLAATVLERHPHIALHSLGGATEAAIWSVQHPVTQLLPGWASIPYGTPLANQRFYVLDARGDDAPDWVAGDLYIAGTGLADGYLNDPQRTAAAFVDDAQRHERLYRTGDRARYRPDGVLEFLGRVDSQVKLGGYRIELGEIEAAMVACPGVTQAVATVVGNGRNRRLLGYVCGAADVERLQAQLDATLATYMIPSRIEWLAQLPLSANGKVDRQRLPVPVEPSVPQTLQPTSAAQQRLLDLLGEELGHPVHDLDANLFDLGASSITVVNLHQRLVREWQPQLTLMTLFRRTRLRDLAATLEGHTGEDHGKVAALQRAATRAAHKGRRATARMIKENQQ